MTDRLRRARAAALAAGLLLGGLVLAPRSDAQTDPLGGLLTPPTKPQPTTTAPKEPATTTTIAPSQPSPKGAVDAKGDGVAAPKGGIVVPPEAQRIIDAVKRTAPQSSERLVEALRGLTDLGMSQEEAYRVGMGRFPVAGVAHWSHDWLLPRYGPGFRFHLGCDVVAAYGTPVRAPVDGIVTSSRDTLGGLTARGTMPDRTQLAFAHLSGLVEGFAEGMAVTTGDIVGYVGDSGNAKGTPHVHVAVYPRGGPATDPKPVLDGFLHDAEAALPGIVAAYAAAHPGFGAIPVPLLPVAPDARLLRGALATRALQGFTSGGDPWTPTALYLLAADPGAGAGYLLQSTLDDLAGTIDWAAR
jgi:murein DD-endopeptidase MepM/ murein hydrolase activator NlpD